MDSKEEDGGMGLDFSFKMAIGEELGNIDCGALPMAIQVCVCVVCACVCPCGNPDMCVWWVRVGVCGCLPVAVQVCGVCLCVCVWVCVGVCVCAC